MGVFVFPGINGALDKWGEDTMTHSSRSEFFLLFGVSSHVFFLEDRRSTVDVRTRDRWGYGFEP